MRPEAFLLPVAGLFLGSAYFAYPALAGGWAEPLGKALPRLVGAVDRALLSVALFLAKE